MTQPAGPYAAHVADYFRAGWPCVIPVPPETKFPPPVGYTGAEGADTDPLAIVQLAAAHPGAAIALRMPEHVIGIDVDQYVKGGVQKEGAATLAAALERWGPLPATWTSTARDAAGPSRIYFFRVPPRRYATKLGADVEVIQRHHRYAVVWPSSHKDAGTYTWYDPEGVAVAAPPKPDELPELPAAWVQGLAEGATDAAAASADREAGHQLLDQLLDDWRPECADITSARQSAADLLRRSDAGSRHDTMTERTHHLVQLAASGHPGVAAAVLELRDVWAAVTAGEERSEEFDRALLTSARKAVTVVGRVQVPRDPCLMMAGGFPLPAPSPEDPGVDDPDLQIVEPPRWTSVREVIGVHAFDPNAGLDQTLAEAVLARTYPAVRYAYDSGGWLLRAPDRWELHGRLSSWAVAQVAMLMPVGDPTAEKGSEPAARAQRRTRLMSTAGARAVAGKMDDLVCGGMHPAALALANLDADPEVLWAGSRPWSLRASLEVPTVAAIDPDTPHLHTAPITPERTPTPLWDAFLEAVWPDPELRAWAVRVLSISLTGYADRALPILLGETGRGKTQVVALMMSVLGTYAHAANPKLLTAGANEHDTIVFDLKGRRLSFIDEAPSESKAGQERLKQLTGGGELTGRRMNQDPVTFAPSHTFVLTANPESEPVLTDPAVRARTRLIPCEGDPEEVRRTRAAIGHVSGAAWRAEAPGVLAKLMAEAAAWLAEPTSALATAAPESIRYLAEHLGAEQDPVSVWVTEECEPSDEGTASRELYQAFTASCLRNNLRRDAIPSETKWGRALNRFGYPAKHTEHGKRRPLRLRNGGGYLPQSGPAPSTNAQTADGLAPSPDEFMTGSPGNPSGAKPQVNHLFSVPPDGSDGSTDSLTYMRAPAPAQGAATPDLPQPVIQTPGEQPSIPGLTCENAAPEPPGEPDRPTRQPRKKAAPDPEKAEAARAKRAQESEEKRQAAIAEAAGELLQLPALVTRDGAVNAIQLSDADRLLATITSTDAALTVDVEHTGYPIGHVDYALRTVQLGNEHFAVDLDPTDPEQADVVRRHLAAAAVLHAHSATADLIPLAHAGLADEDELWLKMVDTAILAKIADPDLTDNNADLKKTAGAVLGKDYAASVQADASRSALFKAGKWLTEVKVTTPSERSGWAQVDPRCSTMVRYAGGDVLDGAALADRLPALPPDMLERERTAQRMTARVASHGLRIDGDQVERLRAEWIPNLNGAGERLKSFGIDNPGSDAQAAQAAVRLGAQLPQTPGGKPSVAKGALELYLEHEGALGDFVRARLDYQKAENALGLFLEPYRVLVERGDGRARPTVYTLGADTGRMSCVRPNLQQVPREGGFRACITADPGYVLISADFASVEIRVAAALSQDPNLIQMLLDGRDMHAEVAQLVWGPDFTKAHRYKAKRKVFGRIYGQGIDGMARTDGAGVEVARAVTSAMDALTPGLTEWSRMVRDAIESGRTKFPAYSGRTIHLPKGAPHAGPNYCIQGTARELLIDALMRWSETRWGDAVLLPVHDEIVVMVPEDEAEEATAALVECMTTELHGVPIIAEASEPAFAWADSA